MNRYIYIFIFICLFTILTFILFEASGFTFESLLTNNQSKFWLALISVLLLAVDVVLPIPSSVIMISNGVLFSFWLGGLLSIVGALLSSSIGYFLGLKANHLIKKFTSDAQQTQAKAFLDKYGAMAMIASRPIPVLAESVSIMSGTLKWSFRKVLFNSLIGLIPICFIYSFTGAYSTSFNDTWIAFLFNISIAAILWFISRRK